MYVLGLRRITLCVRIHHDVLILRDCRGWQEMYRVHGYGFAVCRSIQFIYLICRFLRYQGVGFVCRLRNLPCSWPPEPQLERRPGSVLRYYELSFQACR